MLNCAAFRPYQVLEFPWEFDGDPEARVKLWIVARNLQGVEILLAFKVTSTTKRWDDEPVLLSGVVEYRETDLHLFKRLNRRTIIEPLLYAIPYSHLRACYVNSKVEVVDEMPEDFETRIVTAIQNHPEWNRRKRLEVLQRIGIST